MTSLPLPCRLRKEAFTLVELLVVIAVVGVVTAISLPVMRSMSAKSDEVTCTSRLRQLGIALNLYSGEHNKVYPTTTSYWDPNQTSVMDALDPYLSSNANNGSLVYYCPRFLKDQPGRKADDLRKAGTLGYFYWAFHSNPLGPLRDTDDGNAWSEQFWASAPSGRVLLSDDFGAKESWGGPDDIQMHAGSSRYLGLQRAGSLVFTSSGSVAKISPR